MLGLGGIELIVIGAIVFFILFFVILMLRSLSNSARLDRLERRVEAIAQHVGMPGSLRADGSPSGTQTYTNFGAFEAVRSGDSSDEDIKRLIRAGRKIEAIKLYREHFPGIGLKEAKDAVEAIERRM